MQIEAFTDQYDLVSPLYGISPEELRSRDRQRSESQRRWLAFRDDKVVGAVTTLLRPDDRLFVDFACRELSAYAPLTEAAAAAFGRSLHTTVRSDDRALVAVLRAAGFTTDFVGEGFRISFERALSMVDRAWLASGFSIHPADAVDEGRLFTLDNTIRHDVPGTDGWRGNRRSFHDELNEAPPFDPAAYLIAIDDRNGEYVGLARIWRNADGPNFGLVGMLRQYRNTPIAAALLKRALTAASEWGHDTFTLGTSPNNAQIYRRMERLGAESLGQSLRLVRD